MGKKKEVETFSHSEKKVLILLLIFTTLGVYWQVPSFEFLEYDDMVYVTENHHVKNGLTLEGLKWALTSIDMGFWHPLTWISLMVDSYIFGMNPGGFHLTNLLLHIGSTVLLFLVLFRMTKAQWQSACVAAFFALHPLHVESVAWIAERKDVLSGFFWMLTLWCYAGYTEQPGFVRYMCVCIVFLFGLMAKPMLVTLPCVLLLMDFWPLRRVRIRWSKGSTGEETEPLQMDEERVSLIRAILEKIPLLAISIAVGIVTIIAEHRFGALQSLESVPFLYRIANSLVGYVWYIGKTLWPVHLAAYYTLPSQWPLWQVIGSLLILTVISAVVALLAKKYPYLLIGWLWYVGTLVPVIGIIKVGSFSVADRFTYLPHIGLFIMAVWGCADLFGGVRVKEKVLSLTGGLVIVMLMVASSIQVQYWRDTPSLFQHALNVTANNTVMHYFMGNYLFRKGYVDQAIQHYREALRIKPDFDDGHDKLGVALSLKGHHEEAVLHYRLAIQINPRKAYFHYHLGSSLEHLGRMEEAVSAYRTALEINPDVAEAYNNLGVIALRRGNVDEAIENLSQAVRVRDQYAKAHYNLGKAFLQKGDRTRAIVHFETALRLEPLFVSAHDALGDILMAEGKIEEALSHYTAALSINPEYLEVKQKISSAQKLRENVQK